MPVAKLSRRLEIAAFLHAVEKGIESAGAQFVPMSAELSDHFQSEDGPLGSMVKDMQTNQS